MIEGWLAGKLSGMIIFVLACLAPIAMVGWAWEGLALHGVTVPVPFFGHVELVHGAIADRDAAQRDRDKALSDLADAKKALAQARANEGTYKDGLNQCNAGVTGLKTEGEARRAEAQRRIDALEARLAGLRSRSAAVAALPATGEVCKSVDQVFATGFGP